MDGLIEEQHDRTQSSSMGETYKTDLAKGVEDEVIVNFTPTGMVPTKSMTTYASIYPAEIIEDVLRASELGISMVHLHARKDISGEPTYLAEIYAEIIGGIRQHNKDLILCVSTSGRSCHSFEHRSEVLELDGSLKPDMASLTLSSQNFYDTASVNEPDIIKKLARKMKILKIKPELEVFDLGMINYARYLITKKLLISPHYFNVIFGNIAGAQSNVLSAGIMLNELPEDSVWSFAGLGQAQLVMNCFSIAIGGGVRVGLEDNIWFDSNRTQHASNGALLSRIDNVITAQGKRMMRPSRLRNLLNLQEGQGHYGTKT